MHLHELSYYWKVTVSSPAQASVTKTLGDVESEVAKSLIGGHTHSIASAVMKMKDVREAVFGTFKNTISNECRVLCQSSPNFTSQFRSIPVTKLADFTFVGLLEELEGQSTNVYWSSHYHCHSSWLYQQSESWPCPLSWHLHRSSNTSQGEKPGNVRTSVIGFYNDVFVSLWKTGMYRWCM